MIYFDNASTSYPKPKEVVKAVVDCLENGANPGRSAHRLARYASEKVFEARQEIARLFGVEDPANIIFTLNATEALNEALKGILRAGDHVITSSMEHNSVARPLKYLENKGVDVTKIAVTPGKGFDKSFEKSFKPETKMVAVTHLSNVSGQILSIQEITKIAKQKNALVLIDAAQSAGVLDIKPEVFGIDLLAFSGHKSLFGPQGTGGIYINPTLDLPEEHQGGTGSASESLAQPKIRPDRYESGTINSCGIVGLGAGVGMINKIGLKEIKEKEVFLTKRLVEGLLQTNKVTVYGHGSQQISVVSFNVKGLSAAEMAFKLEREFDILVRAGLHCAPDAHKTLGTLETGTVRLSLNYFNEEEEIDAALSAINKISKEAA